VAECSTVLVTIFCAAPASPTAADVRVHESPFRRREPDVAGVDIYERAELLPGGIHPSAGELPEAMGRRRVGPHIVR
jgi:hypothetical protein